MSPQQAAAITNNEKVFPVFAKKLASDDEDMFCNTASKLSTWLNSEKAYYAAARPKVSSLCFDKLSSVLMGVHQIVDLLEVRIICMFLFHITF